MKRNLVFSLSLVLLIAGIFLGNTTDAMAQSKIAMHRADRHVLHRDLRQTKKHVLALRRIRRSSRHELDKEKYYPHIRSIRRQSEEAKKYAEGLKKELVRDKDSEKKFNDIIFGYDEILHEEANMDKELDSPKPDDNRLEKHETAIYTRLAELKKMLKDI